MGNCIKMDTSSSNFIIFMISIQLRKLLFIEIELDEPCNVQLTKGPPRIRVSL